MNKKTSGAADKGLPEWAVHTWSFDAKVGKWMKVTKPSPSATSAAVSSSTRSVEKLRLVTYNLWFDEYERTTRFRALLDLLTRLQPDVICLQEVIPSICAALGQSEWVRSSYFMSDFAGATVGRYGVVMLVRKRPEGDSWLMHSFRQFPYDGSHMGRSQLLASLIVNKMPFLFSTSHFESLSSAEERENQLAQSYHTLSFMLSPTMHAKGTPPPASHVPSFFASFFSTATSSLSAPLSPGSPSPGFPSLDFAIPGLARLPSARTALAQHLRGGSGAAPDPTPKDIDTIMQKEGTEVKSDLDWIGAAVVCGDFNFDSTRNYTIIAGQPLENLMLDRQLRGFSDVWVATHGLMSRDVVEKLEMQQRDLHRRNSMVGDPAVDAFTAALSAAASTPSASVTSSSPPSSASSLQSGSVKNPAAALAVPVAQPARNTSASSWSIANHGRSASRGRGASVSASSLSPEQKQKADAIDKEVEERRAKMGWTIDTTANKMLESVRAEHMRYDRVMFKSPRGWKPVNITLLGDRPIDSSFFNPSSATDGDGAPPNVHISDHFGLVADFVWSSS